jgi:hypothetical protein
MSRFRTTVLSLSLVLLAACADGTGPEPLRSAAIQPQLSSHEARPDSTPVNTASEDDETVLRDGGNMMGGGGR